MGRATVDTVDAGVGVADKIDALEAFVGWGCGIGILLGLEEDPWRNEMGNRTEDIDDLEK